MQNNMFEEKEMGVVTSGAEKIPQADMDKPVGKAFYSVEEIAVLMGISRSKAYIFKIINGVFFTFFDFYTAKIIIPKNRLNRDCFKVCVNGK